LQYRPDRRVKRVTRPIGRAIPVIRRVRSVAGMTLVVAVTAGGFALATVSVSGTGAIAIPTLHNASVARATRAVADFISPIPSSHVTERTVSEQQIEDAFARQTATGQCVFAEAAAGTEMVRLSTAQLAELTARSGADVAFAGRIAHRQLELCGANSQARPESVVRVG
jgi:hypothetical protein